MRRMLVLVLALAFSAAACGDGVDSVAFDAVASSTTTTTTVAPTSTTLPAPTTTLPEPTPTIVTPTVPTTTTTPIFWPGHVADEFAGSMFVVADGGQIGSYRVLPDGRLNGGFLQTADHPVTDVVQSSEGYLFTREFEEVSETETVIEFVRYHFDAGREVLDVEWIYDVAVVNGVESVIVAVPSPDGYGFGGLEAWAVDDFHVVADLGLSAEAEFGVLDFDWSEARGIGVASAWSDLTEWIGFVDNEGNEVTLPSPTEEIPYNSPPLVSGGTISNDGDTLYWLEGPDWGFDAETNESGPIAASWTLHGADIETGEVTLVWPLSEPVLDVTVLNMHSVIDLGTHVVINRTTLDGTGSTVLPALMLDLTTEEPELFAMPIAGVVTEWAIGN